MTDNKLLVDKNLFLAAVEKRLNRLFERSKRGEKSAKEKAQLEGFMEAGKAMNIITHKEGMELMDKVHIQVFGETMNERKANNGRIRQAIEMNDFDYIEIPAINRR